MKSVYSLQYRRKRLVQHVTLSPGQAACQVAQHNAGTQRDLHLCGGGGGKMAELSLSDTQSQRKRFPN